MSHVLTPRYAMHARLHAQVKIHPGSLLFPDLDPAKY